MHQLVPEPPIAEWRQPAPRIVVLDDDPELVDVLVELFGATARLSSMGQIGSVNGIANEPPGLIIIGSLPMRRDGLGAWDIVKLARAHQRLRGVPIIVLTTDVMAILCDGRLAGHADVHLVEMPFDIGVFQRVVRTAMAPIDPSRSASAAAAVPMRMPI